MMGDETGSPSDSKTASSNCHDVASIQADHSTPDWSKVFVVAVVASFSSPISAAVPLQPPSLHVRPPPLAILYCCLRN
jgi:hypothetical protein